MSESITSSRLVICAMTYIDKALARDGRKVLFQARS